MIVHNQCFRSFCFCFMVIYQKYAEIKRSFCQTLNRFYLSVHSKGVHAGPAHTSPRLPVPGCSSPSALASMEELSPACSPASTPPGIALIVIVRQGSVLNSCLAHKLYLTLVAPPWKIARVPHPMSLQHSLKYS